jgi:hypothetical protein
MILLEDAVRVCLLILVRPRSKDALLFCSKYDKVPFLLTAIGLSPSLTLVLKYLYYNHSYGLHFTFPSYPSFLTNVTYCCDCSRH